MLFDLNFIWIKTGLRSKIISIYFIEFSFIRNLSQLSQNQLYEFIRQRENLRNWSTLQDMTMMIVQINAKMINTSYDKMSTLTVEQMITENWWYDIKHLWRSEILWISKSFQKINILKSTLSVIEYLTSYQMIFDTQIRWLT